MTTLNTIIEEEKKKLQKIECLVEDNVLEDFLTTAMQRAYEAGEKKGREEEAYLWFNSWYDRYISNHRKEENAAFGVWSTERLQTLRANHSELDQDKTQTP